MKQVAVRKPPVVQGTVSVVLVRHRRPHAGRRASASAVVLVEHASLRVASGLEALRRNGIRRLAVGSLGEEARRLAEARVRLSAPHSVQITEGALLLRSAGLREVRSRRRLGEVSRSRASAALLHDGRLALHAALHVVPSHRTLLGERRVRQETTADGAETLALALRVVDLRPETAIPTSARTIVHLQTRRTRGLAGMRLHEALAGLAEALESSSFS